MKIIPFVYDNDTDELAANAYIIIDNMKNCVVIDPSCDYPGLLNYIVKNKLSLKGILLTHAHFDHMRGVDRLVDEFKAPLYVGFDDEPALKDATLNGSKEFFEYVSIKAKANTLSDNEKLSMLEETIDVIYTPYHSIGSVCYYLRESKVIFTGDSLFKGFVGRSDFSTSAPRLMRSSLEKIMKLPDDVKVYPGHGGSTTIGHERTTNIFVK